jgi:hypothetical protein
MRNHNVTYATFQGEEDPYHAAKDEGIYEEIESPRDLTTSTIIKRIVGNHEAYRVSVAYIMFVRKL